MTGFIDVKAMTEWIQREGVEHIITGMMDYLEHDYKRWRRFDKIPRVASHTPLGVIELMPTSDGDEYAFKYVNGHPFNPARGFQTVAAFGMLSDVNNGYPTFLAEMTLLTALRTAATSGMVARHLARKDSSVMAMIGAGSQSEFQALGMRAALGIDEIRIYDIDSAAVDKFVRNIEPLGFHIHKARSVSDAVENADVITTCTADKAQNTILTNDHVTDGVHLNAVGGDCPGKTELEATILERADVFVEFPEQTRIEGEIQQMPATFPIIEVWEVIAGQRKGRTSDHQITLFDSVGFAINDFSALRYLRDSVTGTDLEAHLDLVADPDDPKDLFSLIPILSPLP
ncbi:ornithine cyclodeaminase [Corynebacterium kroppenstedtii]|uniref:ornithine cyclodeaminase n=1 Tax=Corynebacterium sp. PCR 32 TaxID=3351342 RepID=UPI0030ADB1F0